MLVFSDWTGCDIEVSVVAYNPRWRKHLDELMDYPFNQLGVDRITLRTASDNHLAINGAKKLGFTLEGIKRMARNGKDELIFGLLRLEYYGKT